MLRINKKIEYALMALIHIQGQATGQLMTAKEICKQYKTPFDPLSRVLQIMAQSGILKAEQGARGGYKLVKDLKKVSLFDLTQMIEGPIQVVGCIDRKVPQCGRGDSCALRNSMRRVNDRLLHLFKNISLKELV